MECRLIFRVLGVVCVSALVLTACGNNNVQADRENTQTVEMQELSTEEAFESESDRKQDEEEHMRESDEGKIDAEESADDIAVGVQGLAALYVDNFPVGIALSGYILKNTPQYGDAVLNNFNSITCENEMKPDSILDKAACRENIAQTYESPAVKFDACAPAIEYALENNMKIRLHTLVWHSQTPDWFFTEDYTDDGALVSREVMLKRMENYIASVLGYFNENYPGLIYAVDVVNEAFDTGDGDENGIRMKKNRWYDTVGDDYYYQAFVFARKYAAEDMKLFYNDYACMWKVDAILGHLQQAKDEGLIDGIGMQSHLSIDDDIQYKFMAAVKQFCNAGYEVQITELDIGIKDMTEENLLKQARKYKSFFSNLKALQEEGYPITGVTVWGLNDKLSWRSDENPLLFDGSMKPKPAYEGAMLMDTIPNVE